MPPHPSTPPTNLAMVGWVFAAAIIATVLSVMFSLFIVLLWLLPNQDSDFDYSYDSSTTSSSYADCDVVTIPVAGFLTPFALQLSPYETEDEFRTDSRDIAARIQQLNQDQPELSLLIVDIYSGGGSIVAGDEIAQALVESNIPTLAYGRDWMTSAAYFAALGADTIYAHEMADVGGIAVNGSFVEESIKNQREGLTYVQLTSGLYKDMFSRNKAMAEHEQVYAQQMIDQAHQWFVQTVSQRRGLSVEQVTRLADGRSFLGTEAQQLGLIDHAGSMADYRTYVADLVGKAEPTWCAY